MGDREAKNGGRRMGAAKGRGSILFALLGGFVLVGLVPLSSVAGKLISISREALKTSTQEKQHLLASTTASEVDVRVEGLRAEVTRLARAVGGALTRGSRNDEDDIRSLLAEAADERMEYLRFTPVRGSATDSRGAVALAKDLEPLFISGFRDATEALAGSRGEGIERAIASEPFFVAGTRPRAAILLSSPVVSAGVFRGVLSALVDIQSLLDGVLKTRPRGHAIYAVDRKGRMLASLDFSEGRPGQDLHQYPIVSRFLQNQNPERVTETLPFDSVGRGFEERYMGSYLATGEGWGIFVQAPERAVYAPVNVMIQSTLEWVLLALSFALLAAVCFARFISSPINRLAEASRAFADGDYKARADVRSRNEIGELAETFNAMAAELESKIRELDQAVKEQKALFRGTAKAMAGAIDAKDPYTRGHSKRVEEYSVLVARYCGLSEQEIDDIRVASLLHDVGKIGVDDSILKKPAPLTRDEFEKMKQHPVLGANILAPIRQMKRIIPGLRYHHERWKGGGYPDGLEGENIPLMARIIAVADTFDAMTTDRPYQKGMRFDAALARLNELKGVVLDERVVEAFNRAYHAGEFSEPAPSPPPSAAPAVAATAQ